MTYSNPDTVVASVLIEDLAGTAFDPDPAPAVTVTDPTGETTTWTFGVDSEVENPETGVYLINFPVAIEGRWTGKWVWGAGDEIGSKAFTVQVDDGLDEPEALTATYATVQQVRDVLPDDADLSDEAIIELIVQAEDLIDEDLGARCINETTGRKVTPADVDAWRFTKLSRATVKLAALLHTKPNTLDQQYMKVTGPDFSFEGPMGSRFGSSIDPLLNQSGLRRLTTHIRDRRDRPPWFSFAYNTDGDC